MSTQTVTPVINRYLEFIARYPLRPIRSDEALRQAIAVMRSLVVIEAPSRDEADYLEVLGDLIESYETDAYPVPPLSHADMLGSLLESRQVTPAQLSAATHVPEATIALILSGKRGVSNPNRASFARFFHVTPSVFLPE